MKEKHSTSGKRTKANGFIPLDFLEMISRIVGEGSAHIRLAWLANGFKDVKMKPLKWLRIGRSGAACLRQLLALPAWSFKLFCALRKGAKCR